MICHRSKNGLAASATSTSEVTALIGYDGFRRQNSVTNGRGNTTTSHFDGYGRLASVESPVSASETAETTYGYDPVTGRLISVGQKRGTDDYLYTHHAYSDRGELIKTWGEAAQPVWVEFDNLGQRTALHTYREEFDTSQSVWPDGDVTSWQYHAGTGLLTGKTYSDGNSVSYLYTAIGQLSKRTWARSDEENLRETFYGYSSLTGELLWADYEDTDVPHDLEYTYTRSGQLATVTDADPNATDHSYNYESWPTEVVETISGLYSATVTRESLSGEGGRPDSLSVGANYDVDYEYDIDSGLLTRITGPGLPYYGAEYGYMTDSGNQVADIVTDVSFKSDAITTVASMTKVYEDHRNLVASIQNVWDPSGTPSTVSSYAYTHDMLGRRDNVTFGGTAFGPNPFAYDLAYNDRSELISYERQSGSSDHRTFAYDAIGNRLSSSQSGVAVFGYLTNTTNGYDFVDGDMPIGPMHLLHDADGNVTAKRPSGDLDNDGDVDIDDYKLFEDELTGPGIGRGRGAAPEMAMMPQMMPEMASAPTPPAVVEIPISLEVRKVGRNRAVSRLRAGTEYELHMDAGSQVANGFVLFAVTDDPDRGFSAATTPSSGAWSDGTLFSFVDIGDDLGITVEDDDYPAGMVRTHFVSNDLLQGSGSPQSHLCNFTTGSDGELNLDLHVSYFDVATGQSVLMRAQANFLVSQSRSSLDDIPSGLCGLPCQAMLSSILASGLPGDGYSIADFNRDGSVDLIDFSIFSRAFGQRGVEYVWDEENRLVEVVPAAPTSSVDKKVVFSYDAFGRRIRKQVFPWNDATSSWGSATSDTKFLYDGWRVIIEFDGLNSDAITRKHTWGLDLSGSMEGAGGIGGLIATEDTAGTATTTDDRTFIYFYDANGNVGQLIETTSGANYGAIAAHYEYSPYGERTNTPAAGEYDQTFRFSTKWFDDETGLGYWGYRHYDPTTGRWTSKDPIGERGGLNLYEYVGNSPMNWLDPYGLECEYCGPDVTSFLDDLISHALLWRQRQGSISGSEARGWLLKWAGAFDWESEGDLKTTNCPKGEKCKKTYQLCGECVHDHWIGNFMYGLMARLLGVWDVTADYGGQVAQSGSRIPGAYPKDPPWDRAGYEIARNFLDLWEQRKLLGLCNMLKHDAELWEEANNPRVMPLEPISLMEAGVDWIQAYPHPRSAKKDYKDCKPCPESLKEPTVPGGIFGANGFFDIDYDPYAP